MQYTHLCKGVLLKLLLFIMHHCSNDIRFNYCNFISNNASSAVYFPSSKLSWVMWSESHSVLSSAFWPHGLEPARLLCPWNSPGKNPGVGSCSLLQVIFPTQGLNPGLPTAGGFFTIWVTREAQEYWSGQPFPSPGELPTPGIEPESPALQADSLPVEC